MPMRRYEIRNEYSLADPELYRAADKDDPEALLEGVAMAGLVGVLRQLGDLAEFAAEIFHDLHEEVMATSARGHGLMIRIQQLEAEVPFIEKAFLSQTDHSSFFYNAGVDCHPNLRMEQNLITRGDLPRFIMDSYEECRGPPRLFLLDKFDVAGAGACLKRYTDPSFFKLETSSSGMSSTDVHREKKSRKIKKKGARWRNGDNPEMLPQSHAKLHQLFLEERVENSISNPAHRVKLKKRPNGFPFGSRNGKSYMEKILKTTSPEHEVVHEVSFRLSPTNDPNESQMEPVDIRTVSSDRESVGEVSLRSVDREEVILQQTIYDQNEVPVADEFAEMPKSNSSFEVDDISSSLSQMTSQKDIVVDGDSKSEGTSKGYQSDDVASETDNYVDAPSTIESEMDTDTEFRGKSSITSSLEKKPSVSGGSIEQLQAHSSDGNNSSEKGMSSFSSDSQSVGNSSVSDDGNILSQKERSSFSSDSPSMSAENTGSDRNVSVGDFPNDGTHENDIITSHQRSISEDVPEVQCPEYVVSDDPCIGIMETNSHKLDSAEKTSFVAADLAAEVCFLGPEPEKIFPIPNDERETTPTRGPTSPLSFSDSEIHVGDHASLGPAEDHLVDESNDEDLKMEENLTFPSIITDIPRDAFPMDADFIEKDELDGEVQSPVEDVTSTSDFCDVLPQDKGDLISHENPISSKLDNEALKSHESFNSDQDGLVSSMSKEEKIMDKSDKEDPYVFSDASDQLPDSTDPSCGKELEGTSLDNNSQIVDVEDNEFSTSGHTQAASSNLISSDAELIPSDIGSHLSDQADADTDIPETDDFIVSKEEEIEENEPPVVGSPRSPGFSGSQASTVADETSPPDPAEMESPRCIEENLKEPAKEELDAIIKRNYSAEKETFEISCYADPILQNEVDVQISRSDSATDESDPQNIAVVVGGFTDNANEDDAVSVGSLIKVQEEHIPFSADSGQDEFETDEVGLPHDLEASSLVEEVDQLEVPTHPDTQFSNIIKSVHKESEISDAIPNTCLDLIVENNADLIKTDATHSSLEKSELDAEHESDHHNLANGGEDESFLSNKQAEETSMSEKSELSLSASNKEQLPGPGEIDPQLLPLVEHMQSSNHDDEEVHDVSLSNFSFANRQSQPSISEYPIQSNYHGSVGEHSKDPLSSMFPPIFLPGINEVNPEEQPPLPPLPPVQWRIGKLHNSSSFSAGTLSSLLPVEPDRTAQNIFPAFPLPVVSDKDSHSAADDMAHSPAVSLQEDSLSVAVSSEVRVMDHPGNSINPLNGEEPSDAPLNFAKSKDEMPPHSSLSEEETITYHPGNSENNSSGKESSIASLNIDKSNDGMPQHSSIPEEATIVQPTPLSRSQGILIDNAASNGSSHNEVNRSHAEAASKKEKVVNVSSSTEASLMVHERNEPPVKGENEHPQIILPSPLSRSQDILIDNAASNGSSHNKLNRSHTEAASKEEKVVNVSSSTEASLMVHERNEPPVKGENEHPQIILLSPESETTFPAAEDGVADGSRAKLPRPRNPLIDAVVAIDKSKLRKVTDRVRPQIDKVDERDSLLAQIRNKSFNLKPAATTRPSIQGPQTNLRVAAILEKAKTIRQALAGSDEDDDDSWSD